MHMIMGRGDRMTIYVENESCTNGTYGHIGTCMLFVYIVTCGFDDDTLGDISIALINIIFVAGKKN